MAGKVIIAFPGSGKTTLAKSKPGYVDLDFGTFRAAHKVSKAEERILLEPFSRLIKYYVQDGYVVLTNEFKLIPYLKQKNIPMEVFIPSIPWVDLVQRLEERESHKGEDWAKQFSSMVRSWGDGAFDVWMSHANKYEVPIRREKYLEG